MDIVRVRYFLAVCQHGSFTAAAKACGVSQPSVTMGVRRLERAIGARLLERRHPVRLTPLGAQLRPLLEALQTAADRVSIAVEGAREAVPPPRPGGLLGRGARAAAAPPQDDFDDEASAIDPAPHGPAEISVRCHDLLRRSSDAIERAEKAVETFNSTWARARDLQN